VGGLTGDKFVGVLGVASGMVSVLSDVGSVDIVGVLVGSGIHGEVVDVTSELLVFFVVDADFGLVVDVGLVAILEMIWDASRDEVVDVGLVAILEMVLDASMDEFVDVGLVRSLEMDFDASRDEFVDVGLVAVLEMESDASRDEFWEFFSCISKESLLSMRGATSLFWFHTSGVPLFALAFLPNVPFAFSWDMFPEKLSTKYIKSHITYYTI
jgi:hypothetical protein